MLAALWPESIREPEEVFLLDRVEHRDSCPLHDLIFKGGNRERPQPTVFRTDVNAGGAVNFSFFLCLATRA